MLLKKSKIFRVILIICLLVAPMFKQGFCTWSTSLGAEFQTNNQSSSSYSLFSTEVVSKAEAKSEELDSKPAKSE